jgi:uncharacterized protein YukE
VSTGFQSDAQAMTRAVQGFEETSANAAKTMADLEGELVSTLSRYQGAQATAFWQLHTQLQSKMRAASQELETMSNLVNSSFQNYGSGDSDSATSFTALTGQVDAGGSVLGRLSGH